MLSTSARSLRYSQVASQQCRAFQSSIPKLDGTSSSSSANALSALDLGAGRGTSNGAINSLDAPHYSSSSSSRSPIPRSSNRSSEPTSGQFDHALEDLDFNDSSSSRPSLSSPSRAYEAAAQRRERNALRPAFEGLQYNTMDQPDGNRNLGNPSFTPYSAPRGGGGFSSGRGGAGFSARGGGDRGDRGGARGARGGRGRGRGASSRLQPVQVRPPSDVPEFAPSTLPPLETLYATDDYFFATTADVPLSETPAPIFPVQTPLQAKMAIVTKHYAPTSTFKSLHNRTLAKFLPEKLQGPRFDLIKDRMDAYDLMLSDEFSKNPGQARELVDSLDGEEGLMMERDLERRGKYERFFDSEDITETVEDGVGLEESTRGAREAARGLARLGMSWNGQYRMQEKEEMMKIVEGLLAPQKRKAVKVQE